MLGIPNILRGWWVPLIISPTSSLPSVSHLLSLFYRLLSPLFINPLPSLPSPFETPIAGGRGEVDRQQEGWKMTAGWGGVRLAASKGGG